MNMLGGACERRGSADGRDEEVGQGGVNVGERVNMESTQLDEESSAVEASSSNDEVGMETATPMGGG